MLSINKQNLYITLYTNNMQLKELNFKMKRCLIDKSYKLEKNFTRSYIRLSTRNNQCAQNS